MKRSIIFCLTLLLVFGAMPVLAHNLNFATAAQQISAASKDVDLGDTNEALRHISIAKKYVILNEIKHPYHTLNADPLELARRAYSHKIFENMDNAKTAISNDRAVEATTALRKTEKLLDNHG